MGLVRTRGGSIEPQNRAGIPKDELEIDLPEEAGKVEIRIIPVPGAQVLVTPHITAAGSERVTIGYYKGKQTIPNDEDIPNHTEKSFALGTGPYRIFIEWRNKKWEIPLEVQ